MMKSDFYNKYFSQEFQTQSLHEIINFPYWNITSAFIRSTVESQKDFVNSLSSDPYITWFVLFTALISCFGMIYFYRHVRLSHRRVLGLERKLRNSKGKNAVLQEILNCAFTEFENQDSLNRSKIEDIRMDLFRQFKFFDEIQTRFLSLLMAEKGVEPAIEELTLLGEKFGLEINVERNINPK